MVNPRTYFGGIYPIFDKIRQGVEQLVEHRPKTDHQYEQYGKATVFECLYNVHYGFFDFGEDRFAVALCHFRFFEKE